MQYKTTGSRLIEATIRFSAIQSSPMRCNGSPRPRVIGPEIHNHAALGEAGDHASGDASPNPVYVNVSPPHWRIKQQKALTVQRQRRLSKTWCTIISSSFCSLLYAMAIFAFILVCKLSSWSWHGENQVSLLSSPVQTSWRLVITPKVSCSEDPPFVALATMASAPDREGRDIIRNTWGGAGVVAGKRVRSFFVVGMTSSEAVQTALEAEAAQYGDILQHAAPDKYSYLALKTATIIQWMATSCPEAKFLVKADIDTLVNLEVMVPYLKQLEGQPDLALGARIDRMPLVTNPKSRNYQDPLVYPRSVFPPYLSGACYVLSGDLLRKLAVVLPEVHRVRNEDTFLGMCLERLGVEPRNIGTQAAINPWFDPAKGPCAAFRLGAAHALRRDLLLAIWTWWQSGGAKMCR